MIEPRHVEFECIDLTVLLFVKRFLEHGIPGPWCRCRSLLLDMVARDLGGAA